MGPNSLEHQVNMSFCIVPSLFKNKKKQKQTFDQADTKGDERIDQEEWNEFVKNNPYVLRNMTLPYLK